jgi:hypothetical protein
VALKRLRQLYEASGAQATAGNQQLAILKTLQKRRSIQTLNKIALNINREVSLLEENSGIHDYMRIMQGFAKFNAIICTTQWCATIFSWLPKAETAPALFTFARD